MIIRILIQKKKKRERDKFKLHVIIKADGSRSAGITSAITKANAALV
jgi:hypothetical protein